MKYSRPDLANPVRLLSKSMDKANQESYHELIRVINYIIQTKDQALIISPDSSDKWTMTMYTDSDWAGDQVLQGTSCI